jgi:hypothetical protein
MEPIDLSVLSDRAKVVAGCWFGMMRGERGQLSFEMVRSRPTAEAQAALDELVEKKVIRREDRRFGGVVYTPIRDCFEAYRWLGHNQKHPAAKIKLTEPIPSEEI